MSTREPRPHYRITQEGRAYGVWLDVLSESGNVAGQLVCLCVYRTGALALVKRLTDMDGGLYTDLTARGLKARPAHLKAVTVRREARAVGIAPTVTPAPRVLLEAAHA